MTGPGNLQEVKQNLGNGYTLHASYDLSAQDGHAQLKNLWVSDKNGNVQNVGGARYKDNCEPHGYAIGGEAGHEEDVERYAASFQKEYDNKTNHVSGYNCVPPQSISMSEVGDQFVITVASGTTFDETCHAVKTADILISKEDVNQAIVGLNDALACNRDARKFANSFAQYMKSNPAMVTPPDKNSALASSIEQTCIKATGGKVITSGKDSLGNPIKTVVPAEGHDRCVEYLSGALIKEDKFVVDIHGPSLVTVPPPVIESHPKAVSCDPEEIVKEIVCKKATDICDDNSES